MIDIALKKKSQTPVLKRNTQEKYELPVSQDYKFQKKGQTKNSWFAL